ncbi:MAG: glutamine amidotransferase [Rhodospirillales bacterium]|nr:glutamine amidotransferase [Rhodospirillales bacterium]
MRRILLIDHPVSRRRDRASEQLAQRGHQLTWCCPGRGEALPPAADFDALLVYGGAEMLSTDLEKEETAYLRHELTYIRDWLSGGKPYLGFCLGGQLMARAMGARIAPHGDGLHQIGYYPLASDSGGAAFLPDFISMYQWHSEGFDLPPGATRLATGPDFPNQAIGYGKAFGLQFHPEVDASHYIYWIEELTEALDRPGAQSRDSQMAAAPLHDPKTAAWLEAFLDEWVALA